MTKTKNDIGLVQKKISKAFPLCWWLTFVNLRFGVFIIWKGTYPKLYEQKIWRALKKEKSFHALYTYCSIQMKNKYNKIHEHVPIILVYSNVIRHFWIYV